MHLAYVPLIRREASTCMHVHYVVLKQDFMHDFWIDGQDASRHRDLLTPNTEEKSMWWDSPSCNVDSSPGPTDCSEGLWAAA